MDTSKLKPCPFCGSTKLDFSHKVGDYHGNKYRIAIYCKSCRTYGPNVDYNSEEAQDANVIHDALLHYIEETDEQIHSIERTIASEEKEVKNND